MPGPVSSAPRIQIVCEILHCTPASYRRVPWKNGRGVTEELALWPPGAVFERGDFDWRISKARVAEPGPFSVFQGYERILVVTEGAGLVLSHGDHAPRERLRPLEPWRFAGEWPTTGAIPDGPIADFNVLFRRGVVDADVQVLRLGLRRAREVLSASHVFAHVLRGIAVLRVAGEEEPFGLQAGDSLWIREARTEEELDLAGNSETTVALLVRIRRAGDAGP